MNSRHTAYLSFGSNQGDRRNNIKNALDAVSSFPDTSLEAVSSMMETVPQGNWNGVPGGNFLNCCARVSTSLDPFALLHSIKDVERGLGRQGTVMDGIYSTALFDDNGRRVYTDRPIDIDILLYEGVDIDTEELKIPHPRMLERDFVMIPLSEIKTDGGQGR